MKHTQPTLTSILRQAPESAFTGGGRGRLHIVRAEFVQGAWTIQLGRSDRRGGGGVVHLGMQFLVL